jgi:hypothetical protein
VEFYCEELSVWKPIEYERLGLGTVIKTHVTFKDEASAKEAIQKLIIDPKGRFL